MIELHDLRKNFGELKAVDGINLNIPSGQFYVALGPNAAGKTTTIKMISGLIKPSSGTVKVAGFDMESDPLEARKRMAYVPDFPFLYDKLTPWEFFRFTVELFGMPLEILDTRGMELAERFHLQPYLKKTVESLSHGTRQRVAIVSALLHDPEVFVIDEPMVGLDPQHAKIVKDILKERSKAGMTVFLSTHQLSVAEELADRIGIIHRGRLIAEGTVADLQKRMGSESALEQMFLELTAQEDLVREEAESASVLESK